MKKTSILIAMFAVIAATSGVKAETTIDFDGSTATSGSVASMLQISSQGQNDKIPMLAPVLENVGTKTNVLAIKHGNSGVKIMPVPTLKDAITGLRQEDQTKFLNELTLVNGYLSFGGVKQTDADAKTLRVNDLLQDVPADTKKEFIESMAFKDGLFVSANVGGLRRVMGDKNVKSLIASLIPDTNARASMANSKALCLGGICDNATCCYDGSGYGCYDTFANSTCTSSCK